MTPRAPTLLPVGGGKGGVGKSFLTANLALALAREGADVIAVDLDLGNSNLHDFLGIPNRNPGIGELLARHVEGPLDRLLVETEVPGLRFIPGDGRMPFMANITYHQKQRLLGEVPRLEADYVLLDLSAGTSFNTLDLCLLADTPLIVTTPTKPSTMSVLVFIKNLVLRAIDRSLGRDPELVEPLRQLWVQPVDAPMLTLGTLRTELSRRDVRASRRLRELCQRLRPRMIYNECDTPADLDLIPSLDRTLAEVLDLEADHIGAIFFDPAVRRAAKRGVPFLLTEEGSEAAGAIRRVARRIDRFGDRPIPGSGRLLRARVQEAWEEKEPRPPHD